MATSRLKSIPWFYLLKFYPLVWILSVAYLWTKSTDEITLKSFVILFSNLCCFFGILLRNHGLVWLHAITAVAHLIYMYFADMSYFTFGITTYFVQFLIFGMLGLYFFKQRHGIKKEIRGNSRLIGKK